MDKEILEQELQSDAAVMVYFSGNDCGVCNLLKPKVQTLFNETFPKIKQVYISVEEFRKTAIQYNILTIPTLIVFFENKEFLRKSRHIALSEVEVELTRIYSLFFN